MSEKEIEGDLERDSRAELLLEWYLRARRDLPWRRTRDPYAIWVSEIMLQQTQVAKVEPYFEAFMKSFPTVEALAAAPVDKVLAAWSGLGYYRRARFLHRGAQALVERDEGVPTTARELRELPGIGDYTAAAIASIAFDEVVPVLDGNVERVICRLLALAEDAKKSRIRKRLVAEAEKLLSRTQPGESNQALMELGATICRPRSPKCLICPLVESCRGKENPESYPLARQKRARELVSIHAALVSREDGRRLFFRRPKSAELMAGMWELPHVEKTVKAKGSAMPLSEIEARLGERYGGSWGLEPARGSVKHGITYRSITAFIHLAQVETAAQVESGPEAAWIGEAEMGDYAMSSLVKKILVRVEKSEGGTR